MNIALYGGTFDPVHRGHMAAARAAFGDPRFRLDQIHFVPAHTPPHKQSGELTSFTHRIAMLELALAGEPAFRASRLEEPEGAEDSGKPNYTIHTVRRFKQTLAADDALYFLLGIDSFTAIAKWREPEALLAECRFIVVSRPGYSMGNALAALPSTTAGGDVALRRNIYLLESVSEEVSSTAIRHAVAAGTGLKEFVGPEVAQYIRQHKLYRN